jgi:hypothetical protein
MALHAAKPATAATVNRLLTGVGIGTRDAGNIDRPFRHNQVRDRATVVASALLQIFETSPAIGLRSALENYLRDEFADIEQQAAASPEISDA